MVVPWIHSVITSATSKTEHEVKLWRTINKLLIGNLAIRNPHRNPNGKNPGDTSINWREYVSELYACGNNWKQTYNSINESRSMKRSLGKAFMLLFAKDLLGNSCVRSIQSTLFTRVSLCKEHICSIGSQYGKISSKHEYTFGKPTPVQ